MDTFRNIIRFVPIAILLAAAGCASLEAPQSSIPAESRAIDRQLGGA